jgi:hypothetical protein
MRKVSNGQNLERELGMAEVRARTKKRLGVVEMPEATPCLSNFP